MSVDNCRFSRIRNLGYGKIPQSRVISNCESAGKTSEIRAANKFNTVNNRESISEINEKINKELNDLLRRGNLNGFNKQFHEESSGNNKIGKRVGVANTKSEFNERKLAVKSTCKVNPSRNLDKISCDSKLVANAKLPQNYHLSLKELNNTVVKIKNEEEYENLDVRIETQMVIPVEETQEYKQFFSPFDEILSKMHEISSKVQRRADDDNIESIVEKLKVKEMEEEMSFRNGTNMNISPVVKTPLTDREKRNSTEDLIKCSDTRERTYSMLISNLSKLMKVMQNSLVEIDKACLYNTSVTVPAPRSHRTYSEHLTVSKKQNYQNSSTRHLSTESSTNINTTAITSVSNRKPQKIHSDKSPLQTENTIVNSNHESHYNILLTCNNYITKANTYDKSSKTKDFFNDSFYGNTSEVGDESFLGKGKTDNQELGVKTVNIRLPKSEGKNENNIKTLEVVSQAKSKAHSVSKLKVSTKKTLKSEEVKSGREHSAESKLKNILNLKSNKDLFLKAREDFLIQKDTQQIEAAPSYRFCKAINFGPEDHQLQVNSKDNKSNSKLCCKSPEIGSKKSVLTNQNKCVIM